MVDASREGFFEPKYCPRGREDCKSLAQIIAAGHASFICCGERQDEPAARAVPQDAYRFCHKSIEGVDVVMNHDERDMAHIAAVYVWASAAAMPAHGEPRAGHENASSEEGQLMPCKHCGERWTEVYTERCAKHGDLWRAINAEPEIVAAMLAEAAANQRHPTLLPVGQFGAETTFK